MTETQARPSWEDPGGEMCVRFVRAGEICASTLYVVGEICASDLYRRRGAGGGGHLRVA
jgi:hypothetical protein